MTSIFSADPVYYPEGPSVVSEYTYRPTSVMNYIYKHCQVFALCFQKASYDKWADSIDFNSTVFIPSDTYSNIYYHKFASKVDLPTARDLVLTSTLWDKIHSHSLRTFDLIPNYRESYLKIDSRPPHIFVNGLPIRQSILCDNGLIHVLDGFVSLADNYLN